jgi:Sulfatase-modifying factor enzyme 1
MTGFRVVQVTIVIIGALGVSALALHAGDKLWWKEGVCPNDMVEVTTVLGLTCVDRFEAAASDGCSVLEPQNAGETKMNLTMSACKATGNREGKPWRFVGRDDAMKICALSGKRLPSADEWYQLSLSVRPETCNLAGQDIAKAGDFADCTNHDGIHNLIGNVWEWMRDDVRDGMLEGVKLPNSGYITAVDSRGIAVETSENKPAEAYGKDYFWSKQEGAYGIVRGGFYGARDDGGLYSLQANISPQFTGGAVGFRCVK